MPVRVATRATPLLLGLLAGLIALAAGVVALRSGQSDTAFIAVVGAGVVISGLVLAGRITPAWPLVAGLMLSVFSGQWQQIGVPIGIDRPLVALGLLATLLQTLPDARERAVPTVRPVHLLLALLSVYAIGSALFVGTLLEREPLFALLDKLGLVSFAFYFFAPVAFRTAAQRNVLLYALVGLGAYLGLTSLLETLNLDFLVFPRYINDPSVGIHIDRARGPFVEAAANGLALYVCAVACGVAAAGWQGWGRRVAIAVGLLCLLGVLFTLTRQAWLGSSIATLVTLAAAPGLRRYLLPAALAGLIGVVLAFVLVPGLQSKASSRASSESPVYDRYNSNRAASHMIEARPLLGFGWYEFGPRSREFYTLAPTYRLSTVGRPHNVLLGFAAELGLVGALAWLIAFAVAVGGAIVRRGPPDLAAWRWGLLAVTINWVVISNFTPLGYAFPNYIVWLWAGVVAAGAVAKPAGAKRLPGAV